MKMYCRPCHLVLATFLLTLAGTADARDSGDAKPPQLSAQDRISPAVSSGRNADPGTDEANETNSKPTETMEKPDPVAPPAAPLDYEASEQIREDLSVSFPVDI